MNRLWLNADFWWTRSAAKSGLAALPTRQYRGRNSKIKAKAEAAALFYAGT
jgi:transposase